MKQLHVKTMPKNDQRIMRELAQEHRKTVRQLTIQGRSQLFCTEGLYSSPIDNGVAEALLTRGSGGMFPQKSFEFYDPETLSPSF